jgi:hypothetical protein
VEVRLKDGRQVRRTIDVAIPARDLAAQQARLELKFRHLTRAALTPAAADEVIDICRTLETRLDLARLLTLCG